MTSTQRPIPRTLAGRRRASFNRQMTAPAISTRRPSTSSSPDLGSSTRSSNNSMTWSEQSSDSEAPLTPTTDTNSDEGFLESEHIAKIDVTKSKDHHATTKLLTQDPELLKEQTGDRESGTRLIQKYCCGGGCCFKTLPQSEQDLTNFEAFLEPDNNAYRGLGLKLQNFSRNTPLSQITPLPPVTISLDSLPNAQPSTRPSIQNHPPSFVQPHPPYHVFSAPLFHARELTKPGAAKRTFHFDIDVTDYPAEGDIDFKVGGAVGICPPNSAEAVEDILNVLGVPKFLRDKPIQLNTQGGRWPTIWGDELSRQLVTTRRELLMWCSDVQSYPPTKQILRLLAEHATNANEKQLLLFLTSAQGQSVFCDLRTGAHLSINQLLHAFPSSKPPLPDLLSILQQLMPRFYSLSNDPHVSSSREGLAGRRLIEIAVTVHDTTDWRGGLRTGVGSGFLERLAETFMEAERAGTVAEHNFRIPMFRGLMANPLSREFGVSNGPMMLIGAGVGMAPFRGFILNRLRNANCASKIWLVQGVRDSNLDELYSGELGKYESQIKKVVQSRNRRRLSSAQKCQSDADLPTLRSLKEKQEKQSQHHRKNSHAHAKPQPRDHWKKPEPVAEDQAAADSKYVQDEVRQQADVVWDIINSVDGRVFVCGSSKGMGEGVEQALRDVAMAKGGFGEDGAKEFWEEMKGAGRYISETW